MTQRAAEERIREACSLAQIDNAATLALETYGREVLGYLIARLGEQRGSEVFSELLEDFWRGLPAFAWRSSLRTWLYTLARHAISRHLRGVYRRRETVFETSAGMSAVVERIRSETAMHLRTAVKSRLRELRAQLSDDDQTLLMLRIDRDMSWRELAVVMAEPSEEPADADLDRVAARLRQRFQSAKNRLRELAESEGLLATNDDER